MPELLRLKDFKMVEKWYKGMLGPGRNQSKLLKFMTSCYGHLVINNLSGRGLQFETS